MDNKICKFRILITVGKAHDIELSSFLPLFLQPKSVVVFLVYGVIKRKEVLIEKEATTKQPL